MCVWKLEKKKKGLVSAPCGVIPDLAWGCPKASCWLLLRVLCGCVVIWGTLSFLALPGKCRALGSTAVGLFVVMLCSPQAFFCTEMWTLPFYTCLTCLSSCWQMQPLAYSLYFVDFSVKMRMEARVGSESRSWSQKPSHGNFQIFVILIHVTEEERFSEHLSPELCNPEHRSELGPRFPRQAWEPSLAVSVIER